ncbi:hypothetical protein [Nonomuraea typhae]|uniref:Poly(3-hydroxyalkanoate) polymerase subunit PhaE n=1 Tax=Nonomuraea typhae TaxID=2603600 RepID=A0ABW7YS19_9ACTN
MAGAEWSGDMLDRPEMVEAWSAQLRSALTGYVDYVARIRRDAEAMWAENPPPEYGSFEAWWRHHKVSAPFAQLQEHLEEAAKLTFRLEARYRRNYHEIPDKRQATAQAKQLAQHAAALPEAERAGRERPRPAQPREPHPAGRDGGGGDFMDLIRREGNGRRPA